ncbi:Periplasmic protease [Alteromonadaceae bacterium Bs31]|nr:Periplasmic protease [Alteromonadaceae bacterium Bs31]
MYITMFNCFRKIEIWFLLSSIFVLILSGCSSDSNSNSSGIEPSTPKPTTGIWSAPAYGVVVNISDTDYTFYQFTSQFCQTYPLEDYLGMDFDSLIASTEVNTGNGALITTLGGVKSPGIAMQKQTALPQQCIDNYVASIGEANYEFNPLVEFEILWSSFNELYAFFDLEEVDWAEVYEDANIAITNDTNKEDLFSIFAQMITPLKDFHVDLVDQGLGFEYTSPAKKPNLAIIALTDFLGIHGLQALASEEQYLQYLEYLELQKESALAVNLSHVAEGESVQFNDTLTIFWARLNDNMGYLLLNTMSASEIGGGNNIDDNLASLSATLDQVLTDLVDVEGLIVDVRYNEGGDDFVSQYIAGRLTNQSFDAYSKQARFGVVRTPLQNIVIEPQGDNQFTGPVAVLTSHTTASAAEVFSLSMRERTNTILVGEDTAGGFSDQLIRTLPSGTVFSLSNEFYLSVTGEEFEGVGVPADITHAFFTMAQREAGQDPGFDEALEWLLNF